jgi:hypothetical protein
LPRVDPKKIVPGLARDSAWILGFWGATDGGQNATGDGLRIR